jgi:membrane peptidoglycan carboxypeptidase
MDHGFEMLVDLRQALSNSLNIMALMLAMDHTLRADWGTVAREAVVAYRLFWMAGARCHRYLLNRASKGAHGTSVSQVHLHLLIVKSTGIGYLTL